MDGRGSRGRTVLGRATVAAGLTVAGVAAVAAIGRRRPGPPAETPGYRSGLLWTWYDDATQAIDRAVGWDHLPKPVELLLVIGLRNLLRQQNLYDTSAEAGPDRPPVAPFEARFLTERTADGTHNDLGQPAMGMAGSRFGRNVPIADTWPDPEPAILEPNPRTVSVELLTRATFQPATTLNLLAATWIQFMVRDWMSHGRGQKEDPWQLPLAPGDSWTDPAPIVVPRSIPDATRAGEPPALPPTYQNTETHWWDGSQIYGSSAEAQELVRTRTDGMLAVGADGLLALPTQPELNPALMPGWWLGLETMRTLFTLEHNAIAARLNEAYPSWSDEELFQRARLVNVAVLAKIHTVEWTPSVIAHPTTVAALRANWWGIEGERLSNAFGRLSRSEVISGIPGSDTDHFGVPYAITEEFGAVYRMHPLIPDDYRFRATADDSTRAEMAFPELTGQHSHGVLERLGMQDVLYSFGTSHPGAIVLRNYPRFLQRFERPDGLVTDIAATDILRIREFGVPRYNAFRRLLRLPPAADFDDLTEDPELANTMRELYGGDVERVDLMIGLFAERRPEGFAFSETAFRIFILMASRRLNSDRFFTTHFTPEVYTPEGMAWIRDSGLASVAVRHYPALRPALSAAANPFAPWLTA